MAAEATTDSARCDIPSGQVPPYKQFCRFVWRYRDENGESAVGSPPWMYAIIFDNIEEARIAAGIIELLVCGTPPLASRLAVALVDGDQTQISFADLEVLYVFVALLNADASERARQVAEFLLWTLGFRWV